MNRLSSVNSFIRTSEAAARPAVLPSEIATSKGQAAFPALVIMAMTLCPAGELKVPALDITSAGRRLVVAESVKGKGTTTTSKRS